MKNNASLAYSVALLIGDFVALLAAFTVAYILRVSLNHTPLAAHVQAVTYIIILATLLPFFLIVFALLGLYSTRQQMNRFQEFGNLIIGCFIGMTGVITYSYLFNVQIFPARLVVLYGFLLALGFVFVLRTLLRATRQAAFRYNVGVSRVLLVGDTKVTRELIRALANVAATGYRVVGVVGTKHAYLPASVARFSSFGDAVATLGDQLDTIIQTELYAAEGQNEAVLTYAQENHLDYRFVPGNNELFAGKIETELFQSIPVITVHQTALTGWGRVAKRAFDFVVSLCALIILSPLLLFAFIVIKLADPGPALFRQPRLTRSNREFMVYKLRTHRLALSGISDDEAFKRIGRPELYDEYKANGYALKNDPRWIRMGGFLRRTSLDELPQLLNVLKGDISLVGPRALKPVELNTFRRKHMILSVKAGITGLAQVSGRQDISFEERRLLDIYYVQNWSFWGDIVILIRTVWVVLRHRGAL